MKFLIAPSFVESENGERTFQKEMVEFSKNKHDILVVNAPTGAGKTRAFQDMGRNGGVIIVLPTNILADEVYRDLKEMNKSVVMLSKEKIDDSMKSDYSHREVSRFNAIKDMISLKKFIVTNPTVLLYLILNYYGHGVGENVRRTELDMAGFLHKQGFNMIIFDEFHVYSEDQVRIVLSINTILRGLFKFVYSSATPTKMMKKALSGMEEELGLIIDEINVPRLVKGDGRPVQGQLDVEIRMGREYNVSEFVRDNLDAFRKDYWLLIVDRITEIESVFRELRGAGISSDEIAMLDGYHRKDGFGKRVVIASNLVEQGINPQREYKKIVMDAGHDIKNMMQRIGRVGRGMDETSFVYICVPKVVAGDCLGGVNTYEDLINFLSPILPERVKAVSLYSVGVFTGAIVSRFSSKLGFEVGRLLPESGKIYSGFRDYNYVDRRLSAESGFIKNHSGELPDLKRIAKWWLDYKNTFYNFIEMSTDREVNDLSLGPDQRFEAKYNFYWILSNKKLSEVSGRFIIANETRDVPDLSFEVHVSGIPFVSRGSYRYSEILYNAKRVIIDSIEQEMHHGALYGNNSEFNETLSKILFIVKGTAGKGRLEIVGYRSMYV